MSAIAAIDIPQFVTGPQKCVVFGPVGEFMKRVMKLVLGGVGAGVTLEVWWRIQGRRVAWVARDRKEVVFIMRVMGSDEGQSSTSKKNKVLFRIVELG